MLYNWSDSIEIRYDDDDDDDDDDDNDGDDDVYIHLKFPLFRHFS